MSVQGENSMTIHRKMLMPPSSPQPFIFKQYTVREIVTPSKKGNVSMKEISFSMFSGGCDIEPPSADSSFCCTTPSNRRRERERQQSMLSLKPFWPSSKLTDKNTPTHLEEISPSNNNSVHLRSRHKTIPPSKRVKIDSESKRNLNTDKRIHHKQVKKAQKLQWKQICLISLLPLLAILAIICLTLPYFETPPKWDLKHLHDLLNQKVFGQEEAITSVLNILENTLNKNMGKRTETTVILFTGSSGVGKSFVSSIIASNFPLPGKSELVFLPLPPPALVLKDCSGSAFNLIVVDIFDPQATNTTLNWIKNLHHEALWQNRPIIVVLILNLEMWVGGLDVVPESSLAKGNDVQERLKNLGFVSHHVYFKPLSEQDIKQCIRVALMRRSLEKNIHREKYVDKISSSINHRHEGCKLVWSRTASFAHE